MICGRSSIWSAWWNWRIHSLVQLFYFPIIDCIVCIIFLPYSYIFLLVFPQSKMNLNFFPSVFYWQDGILLSDNCGIKKTNSVLDSLIFPSIDFTAFISTSKQEKPIFIFSCDSKGNSPLSTIIHCNTTNVTAFVDLYWYLVWLSTTPSPLSKSSVYARWSSTF